MEEQNKEQGEAHQHVHLFGAEVSASGEESAKTKEEWRANKEEWKQKHREQREQWKMEHREWRHEHGGGHLGGLVILFVGVMALLYTMGFVSHNFWHAIAPLARHSRFSTFGLCRACRDASRQRAGGGILVFSKHVWM